ncbi:MAG: putative porin [Candidatus Omnitrophica bacterium]|nr:putative porin [Candidatus Omnitrophota bacterium]
MPSSMWVWVVAAAALFGGCPQAAWAQSEVDILLDKLVQKGVLSTDEVGEIRKEIAQTHQERHTELAKELVPDSSRNWRWGGDIRLRNEYRNRTGTGADTNRQRIRFRYGFDAKVSDQLNVGARLATGNTNEPVSTNQSFNGAFNHKNFLLDRALVSYVPDLPGITKLKLSGGIIENPFWGVGALVWDDDLNFDGAAVQWTQELSPTASIFSNSGLCSIQTDVTEAASLWSTQGGVVVKPFPDAPEELLKHLQVTGAIAYHDYHNVTGPYSENNAFAQAGGSTTTTPAAPTTAQLKGNSATVRDFDLLNPSVEIGSQYGKIPFGLFGDWVHNTAMTEEENGFQLGVKVGKARVPFDLTQGWEAGYYFERIEPDAAFGPYVDSDFGNGGTNHRGHVYWIKLATLEASSIQLKYFNAREVSGSKAKTDTFQADWVTKF